MLNYPFIQTFRSSLGFLCFWGLFGYPAAGKACQTETIAPRVNVLLICIDDLRPELASFGVPYIKSPNIDRLASRGRPFYRHYVQAPTCGASRYTLLTGTYGPSNNNALFQRSRNIKSDSLPGWFRRHGYTTVSVGKVSHHPGGRGGKNWDDDSILEMPQSWDRHRLPSGPWQHPRGAMHGLANGEIRANAKEMDVLQSIEGADETDPDGLITATALEELGRLKANGQPFFLAVGLLRPHLPFGAPARYLVPYQNLQLPAIQHPQKPTGKTTWHGSGEFMKYNRWQRNPNQDRDFADEVRKHYAACVTYADALTGRILDRLDHLGLAENTVVVLWGDHGWHLGEHAIWGKHSLYEESLRSPLIIAGPEIQFAGKPSQAVVETVDIFPTLCDLTGLAKPAFLSGHTLMPNLQDPALTGGAAVSYRGAVKTIRTSTHRLIQHANHTELYDHQQDPGETRNVSQDQPDLVIQLKEQLERHLDSNAKSK